MPTATKSPFKRRFTTQRPALQWLLGAMLGLWVAGAALADVGPGAGRAGTVDLVVVLKSERVIYLYDDGLIVGQYPIALGKNPLGTKQHRGDNRTPEGAYTLDWRNPDSIFHRSIHISYPDAQDRESAWADGQDPGDLIMIHGQPGYDDRPRTGDWTNGCIAVSNAAIDDIWARVADGTPIHIYP
ncbi:L,D-transpeptidase family protein [Salinisphaera sp. T31B1]|uniref:L,D-transpeptidase family protein n=1 Tax=Salinisphaera sp. T31B1 TaxID=727963 RepID=UPI0033413117